MAGFSDAMETAVLKQFFRNTAAPVPTTVYVSLHTAPLVDAGTGAEVTTTSSAYTRVACSTGSSGSGSTSVFNAPSGTSPTVVTNASAITFASPTANWGTVTDFGIWDTGTPGAGILYFLGTLTTARTINSGDSAPNFAIGALSITLD